MRTKLLEKDPSKEITILDGDIVRRNLSKGLGFSKEDRSTNVRRIGYVASEIVKHNGIVMCANIAPYKADREYNKNLIESIGGKYVEIWVDTPLEVFPSKETRRLLSTLPSEESKLRLFSKTPLRSRNTSLRKETSPRTVSAHPIFHPSC